MNVLLWVLQVALAVLSLAGGAYKVFGFDALASAPFFAALPRGGWSALGVFEMACGILLVVPAAAKRRTVLAPLAAAALAVESLALGVLYGRYSLEPTAGNPLVWVVGMGIVAAVVAFGRTALRPTDARTRVSP